MMIYYIKTQNQRTLGERKKTKTQKKQDSATKQRTQRWGLKPE